MKELILIIKEHKIILVVLLAAVLAFGGWSAWQISHRYAENSDVPTEEQDASGADSGEGEAEHEEEGPQLTEDQQKIVKDYTEEQKEFIALLSSNIWMASDESSSLTFTDTTYREAKGSDETVLPYVVKSIMVDNGPTYESYIASLENDVSSFIVKVRRLVSNDGKTGVWEISSNGFAYKQIYQRAKAADGIEIEGLNEATITLFGGKEAFIAAVQDHVSAYYPTATTATWTQKVEIDYANKVAKTGFILNTKTSAPVSVIYQMDHKKFEFNR